MVGTMHRRTILGALAAWPAQRLFARDASPRPRHKISAAQLHKALSARFPVRVGFAGLLELQVDASRLLLLPQRNRLGAALHAQLGGVQLPRPQAGELDLVFALRYEGTDQSIRAHQPEIIDMRWPGVPADTTQALQGLMPALARHIGEVVLHKLSPGELALANTMGFEPQELQVADDGLVIFFGPKQ